MAKIAPKQTITINPDGTYGESNPISSNQKVYQGLIFFIKAVLPAFDNAVTATLSILDKDGDVVYSIGALAKGTTHIISDIQIPLVEQEKIAITLSDVPGGLVAWNIFVTLYYVSDY